MGLHRADVGAEHKLSRGIRPVVSLTIDDRQMAHAASCERNTYPAAEPAGADHQNPGVRECLLIVSWKTIMAGEHVRFSRMPDRWESWRSDDFDPAAELIGAGLARLKPICRHGAPPVPDGAPHPT